MKKSKNLKTLDQFIDDQYGKRGNKKRERFEKGFETFKVGYIIQQARLKKGMTQEALAEKCGTNKGYISKIENDSYWVMGEYFLSREVGDANGVFMIIFKNILGSWKIVADMSCG